MSNDLVPWEEQMALQALEAAALERPSLTNISLRGGILNIGGTAVAGNKLNAVVVATTFERAVYNKFDENNPQPPLCFAQSLDGKDMEPSSVVEEPFNETCDGCDNDKFGSDPSGRGGKRCKEVRKLALLAAVKGNYAEGELAILRVPVMSVPNWSNYVNTVATAHQRPPYAVLTEISATPDARTVFKVHFKFLEMLPQEAVMAVERRIEAAQRVLMTPYDMTLGKGNHV